MSFRQFLILGLVIFGVSVHLMKSVDQPEFTVANLEKGFMKNLGFEIENANKDTITKDKMRLDPQHATINGGIDRKVKVDKTNKFQFKKNKKFKRKFDDWRKKYANQMAQMEFHHGDDKNKTGKKKKKLSKKEAAKKKKEEEEKKKKELAEKKKKEEEEKKKKEEEERLLEEEEEELIAEEEDERRRQEELEDQKREQGETFTGIPGQNPFFGGPGVLNPGKISNDLKKLKTAEEWLAYIRSKNSIKAVDQFISLARHGGDQISDSVFYEVADTLAVSKVSKHKLFAARIVGSVQSFDSFVRLHDLVNRGGTDPEVVFAISALSVYHSSSRHLDILGSVLESSESASVKSLALQEIEKVARRAFDSNQDLQIRDSEGAFQNSSARALSEIYLTLLNVNFEGNADLERNQNNLLQLLAPFDQGGAQAQSF